MSDPINVDVLAEALKVGLIQVLPEIQGVSIGYHTDEHVRRLAEAVAASYAELTAPSSQTTPKAPRA